MNKESRFVVFDIDLPALAGNKLFNPEIARTVSHTILPLCHLASEAKKQGIEFVTSDVYFGMPERPRNVSLISHMITPVTKKFLDSGVKPLLLISQESPIIAFRFFMLLKKYSAWYPHTMMPEGFRKKVSPKTTFHTLYFPEPYSRNTRVNDNLEQKRFVTMISGNKRVPLTLKRILAGIVSGVFYRELYKERLEIIEYFSGKDFDLYGMGWDKSIIGETRQLREAILGSYRGSVDDKIRTLAQYKFTFTLENTVSKGYVTEKIFDAMFAGAVPIYLGAPDIADFVHKAAFIDMRDFKNYGELELYLRTMTKKRYLEYIDAINTYIQSPEYDRFSQESFARKILSLIE